MPRDPHKTRRICFVTGTRAEFGLMVSTLSAIAGKPGLDLQIIATGMHLDAAHGDGLAAIKKAGFKVDRIVPWPPGTAPAQIATNTGGAIGTLATTLDHLRSDIILVVGDRVEAFAAAASAHISGRIVAHVHGGDRAPGQVDDALRHAITKLAHVHFPATERSARRIAMLGEDAWRIHRIGSPGIDDIVRIATPSRELAERFPNLKSRRFALLVLHPTVSDDAKEFDRAKSLLAPLRSAGVPQVLIIAPNNDPGSDGIRECWAARAADPGVTVRPDVSRADFLGLMRDAAFLIGNSSSGIIEAASYGTPVIDVGDRQKGRERSQNVRNVRFRQGDLRRAIAAVWRDGNPRRFHGGNVYDGAGAGKRIANVLGRVRIDERLRKKLIAY